MSLLETSGNMANNHLISACIWCNFPSKGPASFVLPLPLPGASAPGKQKAGVLAARSAFQEPVLLYPSSVALAESPQHGTLTLRGYFFGPSPHTTRSPKPHSIATNKYLNNPSLTLHEEGPHNPHPDGLHIPQFNSFIQSQGRNYCCRLGGMLHLWSTRAGRDKMLQLQRRQRVYFSQQEGLAQQQLNINQVQK